MIHFYSALPHVMTLMMQCLVLLVLCIYSPCRWTSQCKKRRNTLTCLVGSTTSSITQVSDSICPMSSLSRTDYTLMLIKANLNVMLEWGVRVQKLCCPKPLTCKYCFVTFCMWTETVNASSNTTALNCCCSFKNLS